MVWACESGVGGLDLLISGFSNVLGLCLFHGVGGGMRSSTPPF